jgi:hypothetical protein
MQLYKHLNKNSLSLYIKRSLFNAPTQNYETISPRSIVDASVENICSISNHVLCSLTHRQQMPHALYVPYGDYLVQLHMLQ